MSKESNVEKPLYARIDELARSMDIYLEDAEIEKWGALVASELLTAYRHGLMTGAMPEAVGRPLAEDYIARLEATLTQEKNNG